MNLSLTVVSHGGRKTVERSKGMMQDQEESWMMLQCGGKTASEVRHGVSDSTGERVRSGVGSKLEAGDMALFTIPWAEIPVCIGDLVDDAVPSC